MLPVSFIAFARRRLLHAVTLSLPDSRALRRKAFPQIRTDKQFIRDRELRLTGALITDSPSSNASPFVNPVIEATVAVGQNTPMQIAGAPVDNATSAPSPYMSQGAGNDQRQLFIIYFAPFAL
jgi:hypothetical protein